MLFLLTLNKHRTQKNLNFPKVDWTKRTHTYRDNIIIDKIELIRKEFNAHSVWETMYLIGLMQYRMSNITERNQLYLKVEKISFLKSIQVYKVQLQLLLASMKPDNYENIIWRFA